MDENKITVEQEEITSPESITIEALNTLKQNTVSKEDYLKLQNEYTKAVDLVMNGVTVNTEPVETKTVDIQALREELFREESGLNNLEFTKKTLELRQALLDAGQPDCFIPVGKQINPTNEDIEAADRVAEVFRHCVNYAEGDPEVFTNELQRLTIDTGLKRKK